MDFFCLLDNYLGDRIFIHIYVFTDSKRRKFNTLMIEEVYLHLNYMKEQRRKPGTTPICKIMTKNPYNLQTNPYKLSTPLQNTILV